MVNSLMILLVVVSALIAGTIAFLVTKSKYAALLARSRTETASKEEMISMLKESHEKAVADLKESHEKALQEQIAHIKIQMTAETEKILKAREEELGKKAEETFKTISGTLGKDLEEMKKSFEENKKSQTESSASLKTHLEQAVKNLKEQTENIGSKADKLANALRGEKKMQGCWGEAILENIFTNEGLEEGRDYTREETLRDAMGFSIHDEDSGKRMRPDFILHFPDNTDVILDSKVSLAALADWFEAEDDNTRADAARRNLKAIKEQVDRLATKDYARNATKGRKCLDYVVMFIPNYAALQLAKTLDANIWREAYGKNVLITTEETLMPFLRMIRTAWVSHEQVRNQQQIIEAAQLMLDRVFDFSKDHAMMGKKLREATDYFEKCESKLQESGRSIVGPAQRMLKLGIPENPKKKISEIETSDNQE